MLPSDLSTLSTFLLVAEERSFTRAAKRQGVSPSAVSHSMRGLEEELGVRLLARTTRSVALTEAGEHLFTKIRPALAGIGETLDHITGATLRPAGKVRLLIPRFAVGDVLLPNLRRLRKEYPDIVLDVVTDAYQRDLVAGGFDAGIHFGEFIEKDMIAVRVSADHRPAIVGSPEYFTTHPKPRSPRDLLKQQCINFRHDVSKVYRWEFQKGKKELSVSVDGPLVADDAELVIGAALEGMGLAYVGEHQVAAHLESGKLVRVLQEWCQPFPGFFLYYPSRKQQPAALNALVNVLRFDTGRSSTQLRREPVTECRHITSGGNDRPMQSVER